MWQSYGERLSQDKVEACRLKPDSVGGRLMGDGWGWLS